MGDWWFRHKDGAIEHVGGVEEYIAWIERHAGEATFREHFRIAETLFARPEQAANPRDAIRVSTVFLSIDHGWGDGPPILYETMIFGFPEDHPLHEYMERYATEAEASNGHTAAVELVRVALEKDAHHRRRG